MRDQRERQAGNTDTKVKLAMHSDENNEAGAQLVGAPRCTRCPNIHGRRKLAPPVNCTTALAVLKGH